MTLTSTSQRLATIEDELHVVTCYSRMLRELAPMGHDVQPTDHNVDFFWEHVFAPALDVGCHAIVLAFADEDCIGCSFFVPEHAKVDVPKRRAVAYGLWVDPEWRRQGIATGLHNEAHRQLRKLGCTQLISHVLACNMAGLANVKARHGRIVAYQISIPLEDK